jgi:hypothetical protein
MSEPKRYPQPSGLRRFSQLMMTKRSTHYVSHEDLDINGELESWMIEDINIKPELEFWTFKRLNQLARNRYPWTELRKENLNRRQQASQLAFIREGQNELWEDIEEYVRKLDLD